MHDKYKRYIQFPVSNKCFFSHEKNSEKVLINNKNNDNKCFLRWHIRHLNSLKTHPERITKTDRRMVNDLDYVDLKFSLKRIVAGLKRKIASESIYFLMKMTLFILFMYQMKNLWNVLIYY